MQITSWKNTQPNHFKYTENSLEIATAKHAVQKNEIRRRKKKNCTEIRYTEN